MNLLRTILAEWLPVWALRCLGLRRVVVPRGQAQIYKT
jgi:hypothetical protein